MGTFFKKTLSFLGLAEDDSTENSIEDYNDEFEERYSSLKESFQENPYPKNDYSFRPSLRREENQRKNPVNIKQPRRLLSIDGTKDLKSFRVSVEEPHEFEEVQLIGDDLKVGVPVIINLQNTNPDLAKRIIDFCSGLTYALEGSIRKVADRVFLLTPKNTVVTSNEKEILRERGLYNQL